MSIWSFLRPRTPNPPELSSDRGPGLGLSPYVAEYLAAIDRTEAFGFEPPPRLLVRKDCVDMDVVLPVLLEYFKRSPPEAMIGQTAAINFALVPLLYDRTAIPFNLTIGWLVHQGKPIYQHDEHRIEQFLKERTDAWLREGCPFHLWLTSPACEILDVTFAMNLGWATNAQECADLIIYQSAHAPQGDSIYHPTISDPISFTRPVESFKLRLGLAKQAQRRGTRRSESHGRKLVGIRCPDRSRCWNRRGGLGHC